MTLWVFVLAALAPVLSRSLAASSNANWVEVCTAYGMEWMLVTADGDAVASKTSGDDASDLDHCPLCVLMGERLAPVTASLVPPPPMAGFLVPSFPPPLDVPVQWFLAAAPRGPPAG
ncbi:MAG: DUF2946 domain-containing protein [Pseudomonadota bacterium]|nr:DUF2946 domain-containing protein [Pseudomonadota bacterium]